MKTRDRYSENYYDGTHEVSNKIREVLKDLKALGFNNEQAVMFTMSEMELVVIHDVLTVRAERSKERAAEHRRKVAEANENN